MTLYPKIDRHLAVKNWLQDHDNPENWVAFDDANFTTDKRLILVDFNKGIDYDCFVKACELFNYREKFLVW